MKKTLFRLVIIITALCFAASVAQCEDLFPVADGHYTYSCYGCDDFGCFDCDDGIYTGIFIDARYFSYCYYEVPGSPCFYDFGNVTGLMEFDISGIATLFSPKDITATLTLTVEDGSVVSSDPVGVYDIQDVYENGSLEDSDKNEGLLISDIDLDLSAGDSVTIEVTDALKHDLSGAGQTNFTGFYLPPYSNSVKFYDSTNSVNAPLLHIQSETIAYFPFNGNALDASGNGHDADVNTAALIPDRFSNPDRAYHFDGTDDIIRINNAAKLNPEQITLAAWVNPEINPTPNDWPRIVEKYDWDLRQGYALVIDSATGKGRFAMMAEDGLEYSVETVTTIATGQWQHLAATFDGNTLRIYYNGVEEASTPAGSPINHTNGSLSIGREYNGGQYWPFAGAIDEVRIYDQSLPPFKITNLYTDVDLDGVPEDGDLSGTVGDSPCTGGERTGCDDNCPDTANPYQTDSYGSGVGDVCNPDKDGDGVPDNIDNCPATPNSNQADCDSDGTGDACDIEPDTDGDGIADACDNCPDLANSGQYDADMDGIGNACDIVLNGDYTVDSTDSAGDIAALSGHAEITGNLTIIDTNLTSLSGLESLTSVDGYLRIYNNDTLTNLSGLNNITNVGGSLTICWSDNLNSLAGLNNLTSVGGSLFIYENDALISLSALNNLTSLGGNISIYYNALTSLTGLNNLTSVSGFLEIRGNGALNSLDGLENITSVSGYLEIAGNDALNSLAELNNLTSLGGSLDISGNDLVTSLSALNNLTSVGGDLKILFSALTNLTGLNNITSLGGGMYIGYNNTLTSLEGLNSLTSLGGYLRIEENDALTSLTGLEGLTSLSGYLKIWNNDVLTSLTGLNYLTSLGGYLSIYSNAALTSLDGLENITSVSGSLEIRSNSSLTNLTGLENLTSVDGNITIHYNAALTSLTGLENLTSVDGNITIHYNAALTSLTGLESLTSVGGYLRISENNALTNLTSLNSLTSVAEELNIYFNSSLTSLNGLNNLTSVGGYLRIWDNALTSLTGLNNLTSLGGDLNIIRNDTLTSLTGLESLTSVGGILYIYNNDVLTTLSGLYSVHLTDGPLTVKTNSSLCSETALALEARMRLNGYTGTADINDNTGTLCPPEIFDVTTNQGPEGVSVPLNESQCLSKDSHNILWMAKDPDFPGDDLGVASRQGVEHTYFSYKPTDDTDWSSEIETAMSSSPGFYGIWNWVNPLLIIGADGNYDIRLAAEDGDDNRSEVMFQITIDTIDSDSDGVADCVDNCPDNCNTQQLDADYDGIGDVCDTEDDGCFSCGSGTICEQEC